MTDRKDILEANINASVSNIQYIIDSMVNPNRYARPESCYKDVVNLLNEISHLRDLKGLYVEIIKNEEKSA